MWAQDPEVRRRTIRRAMAHPTVFLAAALAELLDDDLVTLTGADLALVWRLRLAHWPRAARRDADLAELAAWIGTDPSRLDRFFRVMDGRPSTAPASDHSSQTGSLLRKPRG